MDYGPAQPVRDAILATVSKAEKELLAQKKEWADAAILEHRGDVDAYKFDCRRHGDFLTLFVTRLGYREDRTVGPVNFSTAINLMLVTEIHMFDGYPPAREVRTMWSMSYESEDGSTWGSFPIEMPRAGEKFVARPAMSKATPGYRLPYIQTVKSRTSPSVWGMAYIDHEGKVGGTEPFPAKAEDDCIVFEGVGSTLLVPYGLGKSVLDRIMQEMENG